MVIYPYVFELRGEPELRFNHEVDDALWGPLDFFLDRDNRTSMEWQYGGRDGLPLTLPCYHYRGKLIWGLTLRMLDELLELIEPGSVGTSWRLS